MAKKRPAKKPVAKKRVPKLVKGKASTLGLGFFRVPKSTRTEEEVFLDFDRRVQFDVVQLSTAGLPKISSKGRPIRWINNFGVRARGKYLKRVKYALYLRVPRNKKFVYYDGRRLREDKRPRAVGRQESKRFPRGWVKVDFNIGDPAIGTS